MLSHGYLLMAHHKQTSHEKAVISFHQALVCQDYVTRIPARRGPGGRYPFENFLVFSFLTFSERFPMSECWYGVIVRKVGRPALARAFYQVLGQVAIA